MSPALLILLHLPFVLAVQAPVDSAPETNIPSEPLVLSETLPPHAFAPDPIALPRLKSICQPPRPSQCVLLGEPIWLEAAPFTVVLTRPSKKGDHVVAYLDCQRVGSETAKADCSELCLFCKEPVVPKRGYILQIWVFPDGAAAIPLEPVVVHFTPRRFVENAAPEGESIFTKSRERLTAGSPTVTKTTRFGVLEILKTRTSTVTGALVTVTQTTTPPPLLTRVVQELLGALLDKMAQITAPIPPREPFSRTPSVDHVPQAGTVTGEAETGKGGRIGERFYQPERDWWGNPATGKTAQKFKCHYFELPAHFPMPQFTDTYNVPGPTAEGVVIHEGMRIYFAADGRYEVQFAATTPSMLVMLRVQLLVSYKPSEHEVEGYFPLTLPPIRIEPDRDGPGHPETWQVRHVGYSREVQRHFCELSEVQRSGAARLGSFPLWRTGSSRGSGY